MISRLQGRWDGVRELILGEVNQVDRWDATIGGAPRLSLSP